MAEMAARGLKPAQRVAERIAGVPVTAVIFREEGGNREELNAYLLMGGRPLLIHTYPTASEGLAFHEAMGSNGFPALFGDGSRLLLYHSHNQALGRRTLHVLRFEKRRFRKLGSFPEARLEDLDGDGRYEVITRHAPLSPFLVECHEFAALVPGATRTDIQAWENGRFVSAAPRFPSFFAERISRGEEDLRRMEKAGLLRPGDSLAKAITLYYDYAAKGERRRGWERLLEIAAPPRPAPPGVKECLLKIREELRAALEIPAGWP